MSDMNFDPNNHDDAGPPISGETGAGINLRSQVARAVEPSAVPTDPSVLKAAPTTPPQGVSYKRPGFGGDFDFDSSDPIGGIPPAPKLDL